MTAKAVLQLSFSGEKMRKKVLVTVSRVLGVNSITMDDKTGKMTVVGEVDVSAMVMKLRKICNAEIVSVEAVKPPEKKPEPAKPVAPKPAEILAFPVPMSYHPYQYHSSYATSHYQPYGNSNYVMMEEPNNTCAIM